VVGWSSSWTASAISCVAKPDRPSEGGDRRKKPAPPALKEVPVVEERLNETSLLAKARARDQRAFGLLVSRYEHALLAVLLPIAGDRERAADLVQDTFLRAYERLDQYVETHRFSTWLFRIGINLAISFRRRLKVEQRTLAEARECPDVGFDRAPQPVEDLARKEEIAALRSAIGRLPERYRNVVRLRYFEGLSCAVIARRLRTTANVVSLILFRARQRLREELDPA
jgi:RNA polymerase sigma-70 factor (ECF subfamily)